MKLEGRVALITGAGSGMGREAAQLFAREGAEIVVVDRDGAAAQRTVDGIVADGGAATAEICDVASVPQLRGLFDRVGARHDALHVLYAHAGMPGAAGLDVSEEEFDVAIDVNMKSAFFCTSFAAPLLRGSGGKGSIIYTSSASGLVGSLYSPLYSMAKGGIVNFTRAIALTFARDGVRANALCPGPIDTPMLPLFFGRTPSAESEIDEEMCGFIAAAVPMGRPGSTSEVAATALWLASDDSSFVTGVALPIDGGLTAR
jgi:NAD(P)-dependent dehydrogenase (short-subunit alcohol dehydrogenase family)